MRRLVERIAGRLASRRGGDAAERIRWMVELRDVRRLLETLEHRDAPMREAAARALGDLGERHAASYLPALLTDPAWEVRCAAAEALGRLGDAEAVPDLVNLLADHLPQVRVAAIRALGALGDARALIPLIGLLADPDLPTRRGAALALLGREEWDNTRLFRALASPDRAAGRRAARVLGEPVREVAALIRGAAAPQPSVRTPALERLHALRSGSAVPPLLCALEEDRSPVRQSAVRALEGAADARVQWLRSPRATVEDVRALADVGGDRMQAALIERLVPPSASSRSPVLAEEAEAVLRLLPAEDVAGPLVDAITRRSWHVQPAVEERATMLLASCRDAAVEPLFRAVGSDSPTARRQAAAALGWLNERTVAEVALDALLASAEQGASQVGRLAAEDPGARERIIRQWAGLALSRLGPFLSLLSHPEGWVGLWAAEALGRAGRQVAAVRPALAAAVPNDGSLPALVLRAHLGDEEGVAQLVHAVLGTDPEATLAATSALGVLGLGAARALGPLGALAQRESAPRLAAAARWAVTRIETAIATAPAELVAAPDPGGRGTELETAPAPAGRGTELEESLPPGGESRDSP